MKAGRQLLFALFEAWQRNPDSNKRKSIPINPKKAPAYYATVNPDDKDQLHDYLRYAEEEGCISLVWGKHFNRHLLEKIWLVDGESLARYLNVPLAKDISSQAESKILNQVSEDIWFRDVMAQIKSKWDKNQPAYRIAPGDIESTVTLLNALAAVRENKQKNLDLRSFSAKVLNDSKAMERMRDRFARVWNEKFDTGLDGPELYELLGLVKFATPIYLKGPIRARVGNCWLPICDVPAYLCIPPDTIEEIELVSLPEYVLTIENLASFNRHCREIRDTGIVIYTAGFFGPTTSPTLKLLDSIVPPNVPFYHWGDIDAGGVNIARHIQSLLQRTVQLHLMSEEILRQNGRETENIGGTLKKRSLCQNVQIENLAAVLLSTKPYTTLEQENIDPMIPTKIAKVK